MHTSQPTHGRTPQRPAKIGERTLRAPLTYLRGCIQHWCAQGAYSPHDVCRPDVGVCCNLSIYLYLARAQARGTGRAPGGTNER